MKKLVCLGLFLLCAICSVNAATPDVEADSVKIFFRQSKIDFIPKLHDNEATIKGFVERVQEVMESPTKHFIGISVYGAASPEGSISFNRWLSEKRCHPPLDPLAPYCPTRLNDESRISRTRLERTPENV